MATVYILESLRGGRFYIGSTENFSQRLRHHKGGFTHSTKRFGEIKVVFTQSFPSLAEARRIEMRLKKFKRKDYLIKIIQDGEIKMRP